jgi:cytochrome c oxidase subunit 2
MESFITRILHLPPSASEHGAGLDALMFYIHVLMFLLFLGWSAYFLYTLWRFSGKRHQEADHHGVRSHMSSYLEVGVAVVEGVLLVGFAIPLGPRRFALELPVGGGITASASSGVNSTGWPGTLPGRRL